MLTIHLLGQFDVKLNSAPVEIPSRAAQSLLAYVILNSGTAHRREKLAGLLWPDATEANARGNLRRALYQIRKGFEAAGAASGYLLADDLTIAFDTTSEYWLDVAVLDRKLADSAPVEDLSAALATYGGELLPGFYDEWVMLERERLQGCYERKAQALLDRLVAAQRWDEVRDWAGKWISLGSTPEPAYRALMTAHAALGDTAAMASTFQRCSEVLRRELGVEPSQLTRALYERLAKGDLPAGVPKPASSPVHVPVQAESPALVQIAGSPLIGRERELAEARAVWRRAAAGEGQVLLVSGEPGVGKSRLLREVRAEVEGSGGAVFVAECYAEGSAPYAPLTQVLSQALDVERSPHVRAALPDTVLADLIRLAPSVGAQHADVPANPALEPEAEQVRLFESVVQLCRVLSRQAPLLWVIEDAHWADSGTLGVLRHLARRTRDLRLLMAVTFRPVEVSENRTFTALLDEFVRAHRALHLSLARLTRDETRDWLAIWLQQAVTEPLIDSLYRHTEGNPFFVEEVVKSLIESSSLRRENGHWTWSDVDEIDVPHSVRLAIETRLGRLPEATQAALQVAAVLGRRFDFATLRLAGNWPEEALAEALAWAERAQFIREVSGASGEAFEFGHALIATTLSQAAGGLRRRRLHRRAAEAIERLRPDDYETLAYHYAEAGDDRQAAHHYCQAADRAEGVYAYEAAHLYLKSALDLLEISQAPPEARLPVMERLADIYQRLRQGPEAMALYQGTLDLAAVISTADRWLPMRLHRKILEAFGLVGGSQWLELQPQATASHAWLEAELNAQASDTGNVETLQARVTLATFVWDTQNRPDLPAGEAYARSAVNLAEQLAEPAGLSAALRVLALIHTARGRPLQAVQVAQQRMALRRDPRLTDVRDHINILFFAGQAFRMVGNYAQALAAYDESVRLAGQIDDISERVRAMEGMAACAFQLDRWDEVLELDAERHALEQRYPPERMGIRCFGMALAAAVYARRGQTVEARVRRDAAYAVMTASAGPVGEWMRNQYY